jgi:imidazolonepropionase-like amidohydrolase
MADALDVYAEFRRPLSGGVTTVYVSPPHGRLMPGQGAVAKLGRGAPSASVLADPCALLVVLGEWPKNPPLLWHPPLPPTPDEPSAPPEKQLPTTRMGELALLRRTFSDVGSGKLTGFRAEPVKAALKGELQVRVKADRAEDIRNALALGEEFGLRLVIEGGTEAYALAAELQRRDVPVVLVPRLVPGQATEVDLQQAYAAFGEVKPDMLAALTKAGVKVALSLPDSALPDLLTAAATAVGAGADPEAALGAITSNAAQVLGVDGRVGSIAVGKDADLVVLTGDPLATRTKVRMTISDGRVVYDRKEDAATTPSEGKLLILRARTVLTGTGALTDGEVRIRGRTIEAVQAVSEAPPDAEVVDFGERVIMPGMVDTQSHLGLHWESEQVSLRPSPATAGPGSGGPRLVSIADAVDPTDQALDEALRAGVTSVAVAPGEGGLFCGTVAVMKTGGDTFDRIVEPVAALKFSMLGGSQRTARPWQVRELLDSARNYDRDWTEFDRRWAEFQRKYERKPEAELKELSRPRRDGQLEVLRGLFRDRKPVFVAASRADEISRAIEVFRKEYGFETVILGAEDADRVSREMGEAGVAAALGPQVTREERGRVISLATVLAQAQVPLALQSHATSGTQLLRATAAHAVKLGLDADGALRAITAEPARLLKLDDRIGSLRPGRDADVVVLSGDPLELTSRVERVYVNGKLAYDAEAGR